MNTCPSPHVKRRRSGGAALPVNDMKSPTTRKRTTVKHSTVDRLAVLTRKQLFFVGNKFWMRRSTHGRNPKFANPDQLLDACLQYFNDVAEHPLIEEKVAGVSYGEVVTHDLPHMMAMTIKGLCIFLDINENTWREYKNNKNADFTRVCQYVEGVIYHQKFTGAAAGLLNHAIIARDLGLVERQDVTSAGKELPAGNSVVIVLPGKEAIE